MAAHASHSLIFHEVHQNKLPPNKFQAKLKYTGIKYARTKNANAKNFVFKGGLVGAIRLPGNGTLKTKEKETRNLVVRAMTFILNFHTQMSSSQLEERKIFFTRV